MCDWRNPNHHDIETCFTGAPLVTLKGQENQKALMVVQAKSLMVVSAKWGELWQTEEQIWRKRSSSVSTASSILTTKPKHIFIASSQIIFNWKIHAEWRQIRRNMENTLRGREVFYSRIWNEKGEAVKYETIKQLSKNRQRNYHLQKSASAGE